ncbi:hypothetical protein JAAARDRAFT_179452 [Jaapia argillacea MUCL 33604]|uniref:Uncharacterized protein n=1 Tax=Jaapia argillacea MUCL 33604 TaxID=933084 RepID=A0A067PPR2_9AGAM|nr:hypothetical protein JAAARDRAFT_179452 [Jaapia argillacea MUCL 33604]
MSASTSLYSIYNILLPFRLYFFHDTYQVATSPPIRVPELANSTSSTSARESRLQPSASVSQCKSRRSSTPQHK